MCVGKPGHAGITITKDAGRHLVEVTADGGRFAHGADREALTRRRDSGARNVITRGTDDSPRRGLVGEILVYVLPVLLGDGIRFSCPGLTRIDLEPVSSTRSGAVTILRFRVRSKQFGIPISPCSRRSRISQNPRRPAPGEQRPEPARERGHPQHQAQPPTTPADQGLLVGWLVPVRRLGMPGRSDTAEQDAIA